MQSHYLAKCLSIACIVILFLVALGSVEHKVFERKSYRNQATQKVANGWSSQQVIAGPVLYLNYKRSYVDRKFDKELKKYVEVTKERRWSEYHLLKQSSTNTELEIQERYIGIFKVPVYTANLGLVSTHLGSSIQDDNKKRLTGASIMISVSDMRGLSNRPTISWNSQSIEFRPGTDQRLLGNYIEASLPLSSVKRDATIRLNLKLRGVEQFGIVPIAETVSSSMQSDWQHPMFTGNYLPDKRAISSAGFTATWNVNSFASSIGKLMQTCTNEPTACANLLIHNQLGVQLSRPVDVYSMTDRAIKYGFLFICLTFVVFALLELQKRYSIHAIQYGFVGAALAVFYILLVSLSEHLSFSTAYILASLACSILISGYLKVALDSKKLALGLGLAFLVLYSMMYAILKSEDYAFLMGSLLVFFLLAGIMFGTRNVKWQDHTKKTAKAKSETSNPEMEKD
ncbi:MAG: cell envelope integrity protein CreD [Gammaproteobacteria bacterium]|nr:cell envelope integrity protein CreD [Gammaproteobacteria bacterium]